ncbi:actin related protein 2/3 complex, subunit 5 [Planoprotostelium fungivorum]|uniref:Actin-related protein 2/3 complex subunit 5 n=1 Tax=Planoprotostelium fungivorum TaxID=1890364 RepID=A0A2P6NM00_9EUKA|nr:actin related protein 2/3 complex, subunit 5 [Planoprotostelium fungivorum]
MKLTEVPGRAGSIVNVHVTYREYFPSCQQQEQPFHSGAKRETMSEEYEGQQSTKTDAQWSSEISGREKAVQQQTNVGNIAGALDQALQDPPYNAGEAVRTKNAALVVSVLSAAKEKDIDGIVSKLSDDNLDLLMKFVYKGLETGENSNILLKWHESVFGKTGLGSIVRALAEKRAV